MRSIWINLKPEWNIHTTHNLFNKIFNSVFEICEWKTLNKIPLMPYKIQSELLCTMRPKG